MTSLAKNKPYLILVFVIGTVDVRIRATVFKSFAILGGAQGYVSAIQIKNEAMMCSLGYSNEFSGLSAAATFVGGIAGKVVPEQHHHGPAPLFSTFLPSLPTTIL